MKTYKVYAASFSSVENPSQNTEHYRFFASKFKALKTYNRLGYRLCEIDDVDKTLQRVRLYNSINKTFVYLEECEVE